MINPVCPNLSVWESLPLQSAVEKKIFWFRAVQILTTPFKKIYEFVLAVFQALKNLFCGCCRKKPSVKPSVDTKDADATYAQLRYFDNPGVNGKINGIYIMTNETNLANTRRLLISHPRPAQKTIHIGCAAWHNLDIMCARKSAYGLLIDFNPKNAEFMTKTMITLFAAPTRQAFAYAMIGYLNALKGEERDLFFDSDQQGLPTDRIEQELVRKGSWLQSDENYRYVRELACNGRLIPISEDIRNFKKLALIREFLNSNDIVPDTVYVNNMGDFMNTPEEKSAFMKSIDQFLNPNSIVICSSNKAGLRQKAALGREILAGSCDVF